MDGGEGRCGLVGGVDARRRWAGQCKAECVDVHVWRDGLYELGCCGNRQDCRGREWRRLQGGFGSFAAMLGERVEQNRFGKSDISVSGMNDGKHEHDLAAKPLLMACLQFGSENLI